MITNTVHSLQFCNSLDPFFDSCHNVTSSPQVKHLLVPWIESLHSSDTLDNVQVAATDLADGSKMYEDFASMAGS